MHHLTANLISSVGTGLSFAFLNYQSRDLPTFDSVDLQNIIKCICPRSFSRSVINKGLLHSDIFVKHGTLRLLLEALKLLDSLVGCLNHCSLSSNQTTQTWLSLKQEIQNEVRSLLPDPQVFLTLLSSRSSQNSSSRLKRTAASENFPEHRGFGLKKLKKTVNEDADIIVGGLSFGLDIASPGDSERVVMTVTNDRLDDGKDLIYGVADIWGLDLCSIPITASKDAEMYFYSKLLDALKIYLRTMPSSLEGTFDFFMNLLGSPLALPTNLQSSLLSLLIEYIGWSPRRGIPLRLPPLMYKHMQSFIRLLMLSPIIDIKDQANILAHAAMLSSGAFDRNLGEIGAWFIFIPGYGRDKSSSEVQGVEVLQNLSVTVISFLCDAISAIGNNLMKYWEIVMNHVSLLEGAKDRAPDFSPLVICVLQKCLRLLNSELGTFTINEKSMISLYVSNTLKYLLQTQVDARLLSAVIVSVLSERFVDSCSVYGSENFICELRPLENLLLFSQSILHQQTCCISPVDEKNVLPGDSSFVSILGQVRKSVQGGHGCEIAGIAEAFSSSIVCTTPDEILKNFPSVMTISQSLLGVPLPLLSSIFFLEQSFLSNVSRSWPEIFFPGMEMAISTADSEGQKVDPDRVSGDSLHGEEMVRDRDFDASEAAAFSLYLKQAPFHVLFPSIISMGGPYILEPSKISDFLLAKLSGLTADCLVWYLRLVLFWVHRIHLSYRTKPSVELEKKSEICFIFIEHLLGQLIILKPGSDCSINNGVSLSKLDIQAVADTVFSHPVVVATLAHPLGSTEEFKWGNSGCSFDNFLSLLRQGVHRLDGHVLDMLATTSEYLFSLYNDLQSTTRAEDGANERLVKDFNILVHRILLELRNRFDLCIETTDVMPMLPAFYALQALIRFISPFELLELVNCMFSRVDDNHLTSGESCKLSAFSIGFCIAGGAFETLFWYMEQPINKRVPYDLFWKTEEKIFDINILEEIYIRLLKFATCFELDFAYVCLLKAVNALYKLKHKQHNNLHPLSLVMSRVIISTPIEMLSHCMYRTNMTKAKLLFLLTEMSSLHMSMFGHLFLGILNKDMSHKGDLVEDTCGYALSDESFMMLLPTALSYLKSTFVKFGKQYYKNFRKIPLLYSGILLNGFLHWKSFVSGIIFQEDYGEFLPSSTEELLNLVNCSRLGSAIHMLWYHFTSSEDSRKKKKRSKLFNSIFPGSSTHAELLECDVSDIDSYSLNQSLNHITRVVAKIFLSRMLLFPKENQIKYPISEADGESKVITLEMGSNKEDSSRMRFMNILVCTWQWIVRKFHSVSDSSEKGKRVERSSLYNYLEVFVLRSILELTTEMHDGLIKLQAIPFLQELMKSTLLYRFEDYKTLNMLRSILQVLADGKFSRVEYLQLLLAHSQFSPTIQTLSNSSGSQVGVFLRPMSSILRSAAKPSHEFEVGTNQGIAEMQTKNLEVIRLLRILFQSHAQQCGSNSGTEIGINSRELYSLLLSSYGATLGEIDEEICNLMDLIESIDESNSKKIAEMDYIWGSAAPKVRKERALEQDLSSSVTNIEAVVERRRNQFRENLPVDPKICASTVQYFPYTRTACHEHKPLSLNRLEGDMFKKDIHALDIKLTQQYDPIFILRFSIHSLSAGYLEPVEFAGLGLLAVAFVSMSSPDERTRKLGYETLGIFKFALEKCQRRKEVMRLRLLLTYVQNGIEEPWQQIPSVITLFAAEASFIILDPSHDHYSTLIKHLMRSSRVNMKCIPLIHDFFWSSSVNFKTERLWILRLLYAGLNLDVDAQIYIKNSILEMLLSCYVSPLSDTESKELILQIVKKSVKLHKMAHYLVEHCGLLSWLSSILSFFKEKLYGVEKSFSIVQLTVVSEAVNDVISSRSIIEFLQNHALEQLMELSTHLYEILVGGVKFMSENIPLICSILRIITSTLKISQKRKMYQPHWTLSFDCLFEIYQAVKMHNDSIAEFGLKAILMSTPAATLFHVNRENLSSFLLWAISTALRSDAAQMQHQKEPELCFQVISEEDSLISTLLRWLTASVVIGKLLWKSNDLDSKFSKRPELKTLQSLLEHVQNAHAEANILGSEEILASIIFYLQQLLDINARVLLPSVVSALCLLLVDYSNLSESGSDFFLRHGIRVSLALSSKIHCPAEANSSWRWSFYQPWKDLSLKQTDAQKLEELHACQSLLVVISNSLRNHSQHLRVLSLEDVKSSGVFKWEESIIETE